MAESSAASVRRCRWVRRPDGLALEQSDRLQELAAPGAPPALLAHQQLAHRHALDLPRAREHHLGGVNASGCNLPLQGRPGEPYPVRPLEREHVLRTRRYGSSIAPPRCGKRRVRDRYRRPSRATRLPSFGPTRRRSRPPRLVSVLPGGIGRRRRVMGYRVPVGCKRNRCGAAVNKWVTAAVARSGLFLSRIRLSNSGQSQPPDEIAAKELFLNPAGAASGGDRRWCQRILTSRRPAMRLLAFGEPDPCTPRRSRARGRGARARASPSRSCGSGEPPGGTAG